MSRARNHLCFGTSALILFACSDPSGIVPDPTPRPTSCLEPGGIEYSGSLGGLTVWKASEAPHRVVGPLTISGRLSVEPGALVCVAPGAVLTVARNGSLIVEGTADEPVSFLPADPSRPWGGISADGAVALTHARLEDAHQGVIASSSVHVAISQTVIRRVAGAAVWVGDNGSGSLIESVVDSACLSTCALGSDPLGAVTIISNSSFTLRDTRILDSGAVGLWIGYRTDVEMTGGEILGSADLGLRIFDSVGRPVTITSTHPTRISGGGSYPARLPLNAAGILLNSVDAHTGWTGNASDTVLVTSEAGAPAEAVAVHPGLAWSILGSSSGSAARIDRLELEPGAVLTIDGPFAGLAVGVLLSRGTQSSPVEIRGVARAGFDRLLLSRAEQDTSRLVHTRLTEISMGVEPEHPVVFDNVLSYNGRIRIAAVGSRLTHVQFRRVHDHADAPLTIAASNVEVTLCEITLSARDGLRVEVAQDVRISDCDIYGNMGVGLRNLAPSTVDARNNWWGDALGPFGPEGDDLAGAVLFEPYQAEPVFSNGSNMN